MSFKVLLIKPNICVRKGFDLQNKMCPPVGLAYLAGSLLKAHFEVSILDMVAASTSSWSFTDTHVCYGLTDAELIDCLRQCSPDLVGVGGFTSQYARIKQIVAAVKSYAPDIPIVLGGINATAIPRKVLRETQADYIIQGEAESAIVELAEALRAGNHDTITSIDGIAFRQNGDIIVRPKLIFPQDIDAIPWPARQILDHEKYLLDGVAMPVITSRGCPGRCTFCSIHLLAGNKWRSRDPVKVADEIEDLTDRWGYQTVSVFDDACNVQPDRLIEICRQVVGRNLNIRLTFPGGLIVKYITKDVLYWMKRAGAISLALPLEHADAHMRNAIIKKNLELEHVYRVLDWCRELRLLAIVNFVIGMPDETRQSLEKIVDFVRQNAYRIDSVAVYVATPYPGTAFYDQCVRDGLLIDYETTDFLDFDNYTAHVNTDKISHTEIAQYKCRIEQAFTDARGPDFPVQYIRKAIRKPNAETMEFLENVYFPQTVCD